MHTSAEERGVFLALLSTSPPINICKIFSWIPKGSQVFWDKPYHENTFNYLEKRCQVTKSFGYSKFFLCSLFRPPRILSRHQEKEALR